MSADELLAHVDAIIAAAAHDLPFDVFAETVVESMIRNGSGFDPAVNAVVMIMPDCAAYEPQPHLTPMVFLQPRSVVLQQLFERGASEEQLRAVQRTPTLPLVTLSSAGIGVIVAP